jgi:protein-S-isoprenylcysteine O-methyltransferase Ste14
LPIVKSLPAFVFRHRNILAAVPLAGAFFLVRREPEAGWASWLIAVGLCFTGALIRAWARWHNAYAQGRKKRLARTGPYAAVRNPLYIGTLLLFAGVGVALQLDLFLAVVIAWAFLVFVIACRHEEGRLFAKYGFYYEVYRTRVPAWWPRVLPRITLPIRRRGFKMVLAVQVLYASLCLVPVVIKGLDPLRLWPPP